MRTTPSSDPTHFDESKKKNQDKNIGSFHARLLFVKKNYANKKLS